MDVTIKIAPFPWQVEGQPRNSDVDGSQMGRVSVHLEATVKDVDGFETVEHVEVPAATVAKIADGTDKDPKKTVQALVDAALVGVKQRVLAQREATERAEQAQKDAQTVNDAKVAKVKAALSALSAKVEAVGEVEEALEG